jgi:hypothetical protein
MKQEKYAMMEIIYQGTVVLQDANLLNLPMSVHWSASVMLSAEMDSMRVIFQVWV